MSPDKPFGLFADFAYYPYGGMWDYRGDFATVEEARAFAKRPQGESWEEPWDWFQIVDLRTMEVVEAEGRSCYGYPEFFKKKDLTSSGESVGSPT